MFFKKHFHEVVFISNPSVTQFTADNLYKYFLPPCGSKSWFLIMYMHILRVCMSVYYVRVILRRPEKSIRPPRTGVIVSKYVDTWNQTTVLKNNKCSHPLSHLSSQRSSTDPRKHHRLLISSAYSKTLLMKMLCAQVTEDRGIELVFNQKYYPS